MCSDGICKCYSGYTGLYCQQLSCPANGCSNHGVCVSHNNYNNHFTTEPPKLESNAITNTKPTSIPSKLSFPYYSYGCLCNSGYSGFDCSVKECPKGAVSGKDNKVLYTITPSSGGSNLFPDNFDIYLYLKVDEEIYRYEIINIKSSYMKDIIIKEIKDTGITNYVKVELKDGSNSELNSDKLVYDATSIDITFPGDEYI